jgi:PST family polysaccharide transporter
MAYNGFSYWALVASSLTGSVIGTALLFLLSPFWPGLPGRGRGMKQMVTFGAHVTTFDIANYFHRNLDNILIGRFWGVESLGIYSRAYALLMFPINTVRGPIISVAFPAMSKLQADPLGFKDFYKQTVTIVAALSMPLSGFAFVESSGIIKIVLGPTWLEASPIFSVLAFAALIQPASSLRGLVLLSLGQTKRYAIWGTMNAALVSVAFMIGVFWGPFGVALSYAISLYAILHPSLVYVFRDTPLSPADFYRAVSCPFIATIAATLVLSVVGHYLEEHGISVFFLSLKSLAYLIFYSTACLTLLRITGSKNPFFFRFAYEPK